MNLKKIPLHFQIILGLIAGIVWALLSSSLGWSSFTQDWINPFGTIFINALKLIAVPLVLFSILKGITGLKDATSLGRIGAKTLGIYLVTTMVAVAVGLLVVNLTSPGKTLSQTQRTEYRVSYELWAKSNGVEIKDDLRLSEDPEYQSLTGELAERMAFDQGNADIESKMKQAQKTKQAGPLRMLVDMVPSNIFNALANNGLMLQIIVFALFMGVVLLSIEDYKKVHVMGFIDGMNEVFLKMVDVIMKGAPFFVFCLLAGKISEMAGDDPRAVIEIFKGLSWYCLVVVFGLAFMIFVFYPLLMISIVRRVGYFEFFRAIGSAQMLAFSTSSSAATLPVTMECVHDNLRVSKKITSFVLPIGATVNMDGTSLYQAVAVIFLAQMHMVDLSLGQQAIIVLTATLASIGSAAVPSAGLVMLIIVLESVGLNPAWIAIIFPVDRILDMCRTVVNVTGDATVSAIIDETEKSR